MLLKKVKKEKNQRIEKIKIVKRSFEEFKRAFSRDLNGKNCGGFCETFMELFKEENRRKSVKKAQNCI